MDQALLTAAAGLRSRLDALELVNNNIANVVTAGYKADREFYNLFVSAEAEAGVMGDLTWMPVVAHATTDFRQATLAPTAAALDVALEGPGFFVVESSQGMLYTRNGNFRRSRAGRLETLEGFAVRGAGGPIGLTPGEVSIGQDGEISVAGQPVGKLEVVEFSNPQGLTKIGSSYYRPPDGVRPGPASRTSVEQGRLEAANVNPAEAAVRLVEVNRQFEMLTRAVSLVANEMNKRAIDEIPRSGT